MIGSQREWQGMGYALIPVIGRPCCIPVCVSSRLVDIFTALSSGTF